MIEKSIIAAYKRMVEKNWDKIYILVDIHNTIFKPSYRSEETFEWFDGAKEALQYLTNSKMVCLILWTSSHTDKIEMYQKVFNDNGIHFDYVNENPEVVTDDLGNFDGKLYFNIGIDDKFGFDAEGGQWKHFLKKFAELFHE